jgi:hypothetical protein
MRITVSHNKGKEEAMRMVDSATDTVLLVSKPPSLSAAMSFHMR